MIYCYGGEGVWNFSFLIHGICTYMSQLHKRFLCGPQSTSKSLGLSFQRLLLLWGVELFFTNHLFKFWDSILLTSSHTIWFLLFYFVLFSFKHRSIFSSFKLLCIPVINWWMLGAHHVFHIKFPASLGVMWQPPWMLKTRCLHFV